MERFPAGKKWFWIGEVSELTGVEPHVLRYWEKEFAILRPRRSRAGRRIYDTTDVELILLLKRLLKEEGYTIQGAKKYLKDGARKKELLEFLRAGTFDRSRTEELEQALEEIRSQVLGLLQSLEEGEVQG